MYIHFPRPAPDVFMIVSMVNIQVCEQVVDQLKSGNPLPASLVAKMIKYKVLRHKAAYQAAVIQKVTDHFVVPYEIL